MSPTPPGPRSLTDIPFPKRGPARRALLCAKCLCNLGIGYTPAVSVILATHEDNNEVYSVFLCDPCTREYEQHP